METVHVRHQKILNGGYLPVVIFGITPQIELQIWDTTWLDTWL